MSELTTLEAIRQTCEKSKEYTENWRAGDGKNSYVTMADPSSAQGTSSFSAAHKNSFAHEYKDYKEIIDKEEDKISKIIEIWENIDFRERFNLAYGLGSAVFGTQNLSLGQASIAFGTNNIAKGGGSISLGGFNKAYGLYSATFGQQNQALGSGSVAEGSKTEAQGLGSHTQGAYTKTTEEARGAHAEGLGTIANAICQHVTGHYNKEDSEALFIVGSGKSDEERNNAFVVKKDGSIVGKDIDNIRANISKLEGLLLKYTEDASSAHYKKVPDGVGSKAIVNKIYGKATMKHNPNSTNYLDPQLILNAFWDGSESYKLNSDGSVHIDTASNEEVQISLAVPAGIYSIGYSTKVGYRDYVTVTLNYYSDSIEVLPNGLCTITITIRGADVTNDTEGSNCFEDDIFIWLNKSETSLEYQNYYYTNAPVKVTQINSYNTKPNVIDNSTVELGQYTTRINDNTYRFQGYFDEEDTSFYKILSFGNIPKGNYYMEIKTIGGTEPNFYSRLDFYYAQTDVGHCYNKNKNWNVTGDENSFYFSTENGYMGNSDYIAGYHDWTFTMVLKPLPVYTYDIPAEIQNLTSNNEIVYGIDSNYINFDEKNIVVNKLWNSETDELSDANENIDVSQYLDYADFLCIDVIPGGYIEFVNETHSPVQSVVTYITKQ